MGLGGDIFSREVILQETNEYLEKIGVKVGDRLPKALLDLSKFICKIDEDKFDVTCFNCDCEGEDGKVNYEKAIECLINNLKNIDASNITLKSDQLKGTSLTKSFSEHAGDLSGKDAPYTFTTSDKSASFHYDLTGLDLPDCYSITKVSVVAYSVDGKGGRTVIRNTDLKNGSIPIPFDRLPAVIHFEIFVLSPDGNLSLISQVNLTDLQSHSGRIDFAVRDFTNKKDLCNSDGGIGLTDLINIISSKMKVLMNTFTAWTSFTIPGYEGTGVFALMGQLAADNQYLCKKVEDLENQINRMGSQNNCD
jgi:hypothetical protein